MRAQAHAMRAMLAAALLVAPLSGAEAQRRPEPDTRREERQDTYGRERGWDLLGEKRVHFRSDRDVIDLDRGRGEEGFANRRYSKLHFVADGNDIQMIGLLYQPTACRFARCP